MMLTFFHCLLLIRNFLRTRIAVHFIHDHVIFSTSVRLLGCSHAVCQCHNKQLLIRKGTFFLGTNVNVKNLSFRAKITAISSNIILYYKQQLHSTPLNTTWAAETENTCIINNTQYN